MMLNYGPQDLIMDMSTAEESMSPLAVLMVVAAMDMRNKTL